MESPTVKLWGEKNQIILFFCFLCSVSTTVILAEKLSLVLILQPLTKCPAFPIYNMDHVSIYCLWVQLGIVPNGEF